MRLMIQVAMEIRQSNESWSDDEKKLKGSKPYRVNIGR
jgi:hypothetical protein